MSAGDVYLRGLSPATKRTLARLATASGRSLNKYAIAVLEEHAQKEAQRGDGRRPRN